MVQSVLSLAGLDETGQCWVVECDELCVVEPDAGLARCKVVPTCNESLEALKNGSRERTTPARGRLNVWW